MPLSAAAALALFAFLLGYGMGGLETGADSFAERHPEEAQLARLLVWGAMLTIALACRKPLQEVLGSEHASPLLLGALAFIPVTAAEIAASRLTMAISPYELCGPNGPLPPGPLIDLPRAAILGSTALLAVDRHDLVLGATRAARLALKLDDRHIAAGLPASDALHEGRVSGEEEMAEAEKAALLRALSRTHGNVSQAAASLGISRATLHRKMKKLDLH